MPELSTRYPCPVCLGVVMETHRIGTGQPLEIDHCGRCGGVWFDHGEVERLRKHPSAMLWARIARQQAEPVTPCHNCHAPLSRDLEKCPGCSSRNLIDCPVCDRLMQRREVQGIHVDVCKRCKGAWFDHSELDTIWKLAVPAAGAGGVAAGAAYTAGDAAVDMLFFAPDL
ncbi:MAG TPA: zf-TFIIB domain-containing protein, partial [Longimicrobium sp.]|nr:zf-TFIIB domain-containing protein [Longimicrobium sp.]